MDYEMKQFNEKAHVCASGTGVSDKGATIVGVVALVCVIVFSLLCYAMAYPKRNRMSHFQEAFRWEDELLVEDVIDQSPMERRYGRFGLIGAPDYLLVLFDALWEGEPIFIDIVSAEVIFFSDVEAANLYGHSFLRGYALKVQDSNGDEYIIWRDRTLRCVYRNEERLLLELLDE